MTILRKKRTSPERPKKLSATERQWIGRDVLRDYRERKLNLRPSLSLLTFVVVAALGLVMLRSDVLRIRYALSETMAEERKLLEQQRDYTVKVRTLRAPGQLVRLAQDRGFARPERIIYLEDSAPVRHEENAP